MIATPNLLSPHRLGSNFEQILETLPHLGAFYVQARNQGGGLGKRIDSFDPIVVNEHPLAFDPVSGLEISLQGIAAAHSGTTNLGAILAPTLEFDFKEFPAGISFHEFSGFSREGAIAQLTAMFSESEITPETLRDIRDELTPNQELCPCCEDAAEERANRSDKHPLFEILKAAKEGETCLQAHLLSDHVNLTCEFTPQRVFTNGGYLILSSKDCEAAMHINMRYVHALAIDREWIEKRPCSSLKIFDPHGNQNFKLLSTDPGDARRWQKICEISSEMRRQEKDRRRKRCE